MTTVYETSDHQLVAFQNDHLQLVALLEMLKRNHSPDKGDVIPVVATHWDLELVRAICILGYLPCFHQQTIIPEEFDSFQQLAEYFGIAGDLVETIDEENDHLNDFLRVLGLEVIEDDFEEQYEGWSDEMISNQLREDREMDSAIWSWFSDNDVECGRCRM